MKPIHMAEKKYRKQKVKALLQDEVVVDLEQFLFKLYIYI